MDPRTPVLVGAGQVVQRPEDLGDDVAGAMEPLALMQEAIERAVADAGAPKLAASATAVRVVKGAWKYGDPGRLLAERLGASGARTGVSTDGGNTPQSLVNRSCREILDGVHEVVVLVGAEAIWSRRRARRNGQWISVTEQEGVEPDEILGVDVSMSSEFETERGMQMPVNFYPLFESTVRARRGETLDEHRDRVARLWSGFNDVAVRNPYAWMRTPMTAEEIREPSASNRMVGFPYTKAMNSNWDLDQGAAVILASVEAAERLGVPRDRWVFPLAGTDAMDTAHVTNRGELGTSPAIRHAGRHLFDLAGRGVDDVGHVDLYSCFPSAVQICATELGLPLDRQLTVTGGLTFAGGPLNNYVMHSIATMAGVLRDDPGSLGLCSANGGYTTKHALGLYSTTPPETPFRAESVQDLVDAEPTTKADPEHAGEVTVEAYTVMHDHDGPAEGLFALRTPGGGRTWGRSHDKALLADVLTDEAIAKRGELDSEGVLSL
jgi:acetyl-CoA C-acetyltransferase